jgi:hypothetical protein
LPFQAGYRVEVIVLLQQLSRVAKATYSLRGLPVKYDFPFEDADVYGWGINRVIYAAFVFSERAENIRAC